ncbi:MAG: hypothetical protein COU29_00900 [Candidatus Magasanikbacteria bacterium CG10_big_fil_rev_8_21_14_0_10_36_32]|uniref:Uncharacterized protein n=1 Tax=Candidatus Magasanikbacteria bacterium CG10_big_fil_rev_8_21_14_0_10_36_32 TaxID=1974646 RepID=A0A2M6W6H9_9BACT|nr:MAG: hypothetical protein COU29_00900 [Candidatus Magasanikbacteria bacterium CG10_big_fil_rev_8_21_14_0_10_36_32]
MDVKIMDVQTKIQERLEKIKTLRSELAMELLNLEEEGRKLRRDVLKIVDKAKQTKIMKFISKQN